ncbi:hypothetical protein IC229_14500 [Spirosoma sp. BT702]|uniref:RiboL-PSP-HEPN domain-containing protein n=1 Tax=Spirosoma profusum TaxID=2771354 RepID=A0A926XWE4_9BACT|nr:hypothetical protein [Spirosoma profusum]MBD2701857.1 hypothetical protein [Spirosoma profusum]
MTFRDLRDAYLSLLEDSALAELLLETVDIPFHRRTYIRTIFASIEGSIWLMKQVCLVAEKSPDSPEMPVSEYLLLSETDYSLKSNGDVRQQAKFLPLTDNLQFVAKVLNYRHSAGINLGVGTKGWENFQEAIKIRNRITHPKSSDDYAITDTEMQLCIKVSHWFNDLTKTFLTRLLINAGLDSTNEQTV